MVSFAKTTEILLSLNLSCVCYWGTHYRATALHVLLFNSALPYGNCLRMTFQYGRLLMIQLWQMTLLNAGGNAEDSHNSNAAGQILS